jgi:hypothetical protein
VSGRDDEIVANFTSGIGPLLDTLVGSLAGSLAFGLPTYEGLGVTDLATQPSADGAWLGFRAGIGELPYSRGCDETGSCGGGCSGGAGAPAIAVLVAVGAARRRIR